MVRREALRQLYPLPGRAPLHAGDEHRTAAVEGGPNHRDRHAVPGASGRVKARGRQGRTPFPPGDSEDRSAVPTFTRVAIAAAPFVVAGARCSPRRPWTGSRRARGPRVCVVRKRPRAWWCSPPPPCCSAPGTSRAASSKCSPVHTGGKSYQLAQRVIGARWFWSIPIALIAFGIFAGVAGEVREGNGRGLFTMVVLGAIAVLAGVVRDCSIASSRSSPSVFGMSMRTPEPARPPMTHDEMFELGASYDEMLQSGLDLRG